MEFWSTIPVFLGILIASIVAIAIIYLIVRISVALIGILLMIYAFHIAQEIQREYPSEIFKEKVLMGLQEFLIVAIPALVVATIVLAYESSEENREKIEKLENQINGSKNENINTNHNDSSEEKDV